MTAIHEWKRLVLENGSSIFGQKKELSPEKQVETVVKEDLAQKDGLVLSLSGKTKLLKVTRSKFYY
jgi:hypothetical protein